ncbi:hypothetical protein ES705_45719 [subsurface metagenome]
MRQEGETQVLVHWMSTLETNPSISVPIEAGARGELIAINSVIYTPPDISTTVHMTLMTALSTNPEHEAKPPASIKEFMESKALYAKKVWINEGSIIPNAGGYAIAWSIETKAIELYGLLRPRRQIWVVYAVSMIPQYKWFGLEVNYRPVKIDDITLSEYNQRYGLYKRT